MTPLCYPWPPSIAVCYSSPPHLASYCLSVLPTTLCYITHHSNISWDPFLKCCFLLPPTTMTTLVLAMIDNLRGPRTTFYTLPLASHRAIQHSTFGIMRSTLNLLTFTLCMLLLSSGPILHLQCCLHTPSNTSLLQYLFYLRIVASRSHQPI